MYGMYILSYCGARVYHAKSSIWEVEYIQRWAPALFSRFCAFALVSAEPKNERESEKKKAEAPSAK
jgi:hypothetical protein